MSTRQLFASVAFFGLGACFARFVRNEYLAAFLSALCWCVGMFVVGFRSPLSEQRPSSEERP